MNKETKASEEFHYEPHTPARPMKVVMDDEGTPWLCDDEVDPKGNLSKQGCWNCGDVAFTRDD